ncbi:MAG: MATE family efflux transporter [Bacteroidales bacterium]|nr:MATE family efflux transporter [Bacteroidales bacterium]MCF8391621.1 MATE family efflux transporter [Bacteroidales bacterium]
MSGKNHNISAAWSLFNSFKWKSFWIDLKDAIGGNDKDFTSIRLSKALFLLSVPMVLEMLMESTFAIIDILFVSRLGADAVATVGITESLMTIVYAIAFGLSISTTALISRRIGEKKKDAASITAVQAIITGLFISFFIMIPGLFFSRELLGLMGASESVIETGYKYPMIMLSGNGIIMLLFIINAVFRSAGDAALSMRVLLVANLLNIVLDPLLIFGWGPFPELGIAGAAIATNIGRGIAVIYQFYLLFRGNGRVKILLQHLKISFSLIKKIIKLSLGGIGQNLIATSSWVFMVRIIAEFGSEVLAGYTIAIRIIIFSLLPSWGLANAAATLVGQNLGAGKPDRAEKTVWTAGIANMILLGLFGIAFILKTEFFIRMLTGEAGIISNGIEGLRILSFGFLFYAMGMVMSQAFNGAGDTTTPTWINFFAFWCIEIPLAYFLAMKFGLEQNGVYTAIVIAESCLAVIGIVLFRRGRWKTRVV